MARRKHRTTATTRGTPAARGRAGVATAARPGPAVAAPLPPESAAPRKILVAAFAIALVALSAYSLTLYPGVPGGDAGELIVAAQTLAIPHPPGYPLFVLLAKPFTWLPAGTLAWRVNLFSAVCDGVAAGLLAGAAGTLARSAWAGLAAGGLFAFSPTVWAYATGAEVFALNNLLVSLALFLATRAWTSRDARFVYATAFAVGLGISNHHTSAVTGVILLGGVVWHTRDRWRSGQQLALLGGALAAGLTPYLYLPFSAASPAQWGDLTTLSGVVTHLLRRDYGTLRLSGSAFSGRVPMVEQLAYYGRDALAQLLWVGVPLAAWGLYRGLRAAATRMPAAVSLAGVVVYLGAFHSLANLRLDQPLLHGVVARFWQQPNLFVCFWAGIGVAALGAIHRAVPAALALALVAGQVGLNWSASDQHGNWIVSDYAASLLKPLPRGALVLTRGDINLNSTRYLQAGEGVRPDLAILDQEMLTYRWMKGHVQHLRPDVLLPGTHYHVSEPGAYNLRQLIEANIGRRPVFVCGGVKEGDNSVEGVFDLWPLGLCDEVLPRAAAVDVADWLRRSGDALPTFRPGTRRDVPLDSWERVAWDDYWEARSRRGFTLLTVAIARGDGGPLFEQAGTIYDELVRAHPSPPPHYFKNLGIAYGRLASVRPAVAAKAIEALRTYQRVAPPDDPDAPAIGKVILELEAIGR